ncbi:hypothetical protein GCM10023203_38060 [Actinomycetospora straminea]|uniref:DUF4352 domain-containing protein n=2 Tax=Actinomycetospora straminea TaxID=663607 RepID=A0ABP9EQB8_9PSEU
MSAPEAGPNTSSWVWRVLVGTFAVIGVLFTIAFAVFLVTDAGSQSAADSAPRSYTITPPTVSAAAPTNSGGTSAGGYLDFGASYVVPSGAWELSTSTPRAYTLPSSTAETGAERYVRVDITITNRTGRYVNVYDEWQATLGVDGAITRGVIGVEQGARGLGFPPNEAVASGRSVTWGVVWPLADTPGTLQLGLDPRGDRSGLSHVAYQGRV